MITRLLLVVVVGKPLNTRELVINKDTTVSNGIKGHQHRKKNELKKKYFKIYDLDF